MLNNTGTDLYLHLQAALPARSKNVHQVYLIGQGWRVRQAVRMNDVQAIPS